MLTSIVLWACYTWAISKFCKKHFETTVIREISFIVLLFTAMLIVNMISTHYFVPHIICALLSHIILIGLVLLFFRAEFGKKILAASVLIAIITMLGDFCDSLLCFLTLYMMHTVKGIPEPFLADWHGYLITCIHIAAVTLTIYGISGRFESVFSGKTRQWYITAALPLLVLTTVIDIANWGASNGIMVISRESMGLYYDQLFSHAEIGILAALAMFAAGFYLFGMNRIDLEQRKSSQYQAQIAAYKTLDEQYRSAERLRHDMKNHVIALSGLLRNKEYEKISEYLQNMENSGKLEYSGEITGNRAVDAILYQKKTQADQADILWECDVRIPKACRINEFDLCVLFGNLLDNAVEACIRQGTQNADSRFISIHAGTVKNCFLLEVRNSTDTADTPNSAPTCENARTARHTHKQNPGEHGIGLLNVRDVVERYDGVIDMSASNGIFTISVLIPMRDC
ncbi:MAG: sensor histidine kinase [Lachnospiraceae bacterium]|nr:sensor histidine kinase [Lachnospiraceae bacterium]